MLRAIVVVLCLAAADAALAKEKALTEDYAGEVAHWVDLAKDLRGQLDEGVGKGRRGEHGHPVGVIDRTGCDSQGDGEHDGEGRKEAHSGCSGFNGGVRLPRWWL